MDAMDTQAKETRKRYTYKQKMVRIALSLPRQWIDLADQEAAKALTSRSDILRAAIQWYLLPQGRDLTHLNTDEIYKTLKQRESRAAMKRLIKNINKFVD